MCREIIIVDAEYDEHYRFEGYLRLKAALEDEMCVTLAMEPKGCAPDNKCADDMDRTSLDAETAQIQGQKQKKSFTGQFPIMEGKISEFPLWTKGRRVEPVSISVKYIKMSIDQNVFKHLDNAAASGSTARERYGDSVVDYYLATLTNTCAKVNPLTKCAFPQFSTFRQSYTKEQFQAYIDLGYAITTNYLQWCGNKLSVKQPDMKPCPATDRPQR